MEVEKFRIRLNCLDHYQASPTEFDPAVTRPVSEDAGSKDRPRISVIRVFGATETGQKVLMHVHGALQYAYIEYSGSLKPEEVDVAIRTLWLSIDHALAVSYRKNVYDGRNVYVGHISLVKGVPFYGFHVGYKFYLKIYLLNPLHMTRLADLLREGAVMKRVLQPYESHMQYLAQWMCDYNLYGCAYIECSKVKFRGPVPEYHELRNPTHMWHDKSIPIDAISDEVTLPKQSHCTLEVDVCVQDILNRRGIEPRPLHHDFVERLRPLPPDVKLVQSMAGLWKDETRRRKARMGLKDPNSTPFPPEVLITMSADPRNKGEGGWIHEAEYRQKILQLAQQEHDDSEGGSVTFENFIGPFPMEDTIQTALQSVEDLYPLNLEEAKGRKSNSFGNMPMSTQAIVDENLVNGISSAGSDTSAGIVNASRTEKHPTSTEDSDDSDPTVSTVKSPISSGELAKVGVRTNDEVHLFHEDNFTAPDEYRVHGPPSNCDPGFHASARKEVQRRSKRRYVLIDEDEPRREATRLGLHPNSDFTSYPDVTEDHDSDIERTSPVLRSHTRLDRAPEVEETLPASQQSTLSFSITKNANEARPIHRPSQGSSSSRKTLLEPKSQSKEQQSPIQDRNVTESENSRSAYSDKSIRNLRTLPLQLSGLNGLRETTGDIQTYHWHRRPPSLRHVQDSMAQHALPDVIYQEAHYSKEEDVPDRQREYAGKEFKLESLTVPYLPDFDSTGSSFATFGRKAPTILEHAVEEVADHQRRQRCAIKNWIIEKPPPRHGHVCTWLEMQDVPQRVQVKGEEMGKGAWLSQIDVATQKNRHGFKYSQKQTMTSVQHETQYMSVMSLEVHVNTRGSLAPNPEEDQLSCIFWCVQTDDEDISINTRNDGMHMGIVVVADRPFVAKSITRNLAVDVDEEATELDALTRIVDIVRFYDPDILTGYEVHNSSWGYLIERARVKYDMNLCDELSRMKSQSHGRFGKDEDRWGFNHTSTVRVTGRHTINIWRAMRGELNLLQYTMENVVFHLLHQRIPHYSFSDLTKWYRGRNPRNLAKVIEYFTSRVQLDLEILEANELVPRTSEQARLLGVDWFSVISRGSQFKVESLMFRIAKPENLILVSPSRRQVGGQNALECLPLVMEPQSDFYSSPMLVLDFQSLYPSVMIAYNYCYSTFLGRVVGWRGTNKMGFSDYRRQLRLVELLKDYVNVAPNGIMYVKQEIRTSLLAKMLSEILETRVMVKSGMKIDRDDKTLQMLLNNRQLALKLIANVTYGYTSASFSGRMPCSEIADSIVQTGRETLERAIALIHSVERWGAEVVYGDTDSLFVYLKGRTRAQAFDIGEEIAEAITKMNPRPVKLKFEKVYHPCVLLAKKRYVGFKYESRKQTQPEFEAKGIETVRRDGTPAEQKIEENAIKILFRGADLSQVKAFFQAQCAKIMRGKVSIQDFCFAREVKLGTYSDKGPPPPGALISARRMLEDPRLEPQYGERVPYVVITGGPGARLIDRCVAPDVLLNDAQSELDAEYYISKNIIPPLERIFNLVGANVRQWYDEMPKYQRIRRVEAVNISDVSEQALMKKTLESYMKASTCLVCRDALDTELPLCRSCHEQAPQSLLHLRAKLVRSERQAADLARICRSCSGLGPNEEVRCDSKDCPVFFSRKRQAANLASDKAQILPVLQILECEAHNNVGW